MSDEIGIYIKQMVSKFLGWKLPKGFCPDDGISFDPINSKGTKWEGRREPIGTNLFDAQQAKEMLEYCAEPLLTAYAALQAENAKQDSALRVFADEIDALKQKAINRNIELKRVKNERNILLDIWRSPVEAPVVPEGDYGYFWVAVCSNGKIINRPACYLNKLQLSSDDEDVLTTGWFDYTDPTYGEFDSEFRLMLGSEDRLIAWRSVTDYAESLFTGTEGEG